MAAEVEEAEPNPGNVYEVSVVGRREPVQIGGVTQIDFGDRGELVLSDEDRVLAIYAPAMWRSCELAGEDGDDAAG